MTNEKIEKAAREVRSWLEDAVGDMAYGYVDFLDEKWSKKIEQAKRDQVIDLKGWLADEYFNDVPTLQDICGDRIHDEAYLIAKTHKSPRHDQAFILICKAMQKTAHTALFQALDNMIADHEKRIKKNEEKKL